jgi:hypothetical protein
MVETLERSVEFSAGTRTTQSYSTSEQSFLQSYASRELNGNGYDSCSDCNSCGSGDCNSCCSSTDD